MNTTKKRPHPSEKTPIAAYIAFCAPPAVLIALFYSLRGVTGVMDWANANISVPVRRFLGLLASFFPFSVMEVVLTAAGIWIIFFLVKTVRVALRRRQWLKILLRRLMLPAVLAVYVWCLWCWLWSAGYFAPGLAEKNNLLSRGATTAELLAAAELFRDRANELAPLVTRDADGHYIENRRVIFAASADIYDNLVHELPSLNGRQYRPKPMAWSWLMSRTGYTGIYFALTGEANINIRAPGCLIPATVAHEIAHQRGVFSEDEANFAAIAACVTSGNTAYEYSGWLCGLTHLQNALWQSSVPDNDFTSWNGLRAGYCDELLRDLQDTSDYWQSQKTVDTGIALVDDALTAVTETVSDAVTTFYDGYLKSQNQELGVRSYGACVDLLVCYFS